MNETKLVQKILKEGEAVVKRQDRLVSAVDKVLKESGKPMNNLDKIKLATVIDNVSNLMMLNESDGTQVTDIAKKNEFLNLVVTTFAKSTLPATTMTFAMTQESSIVYYLAYKYDTTKGGITKGDTFNAVNQYWVDTDDVGSAARFASNEIDIETIGEVAAAGTYKFEFTPVLPGTIKITDGEKEYTDKDGGIFDKTTKIAEIDYTTGILTVEAEKSLTKNAVVEYEYDNYTNTPIQVPKLKLEVSKLSLNAKPYTLGYEYNTFAAYNLLRSQNVDLKDLLGEGVSNELVSEIDALVYEDFAKSGTNLSVSWNMTPEQYYDEKLYMQSFGLRLVQAQQLVFNKTRKIRPNVCILGTNGSYVARNLDGFKSTEVAGAVGVHVIGEYKGLLMVENPFQDEDLNILTWKSGDFSGSYAVGEYLPVIQTPLLQYENFQNKSSVATVKARKMLNTDFFAEVIITHS